MWEILTLSVLYFTCYGEVIGMGPGGPDSDRPMYSTSLETSLRKELFMGYEVLQRPEERVSVRVSLTILTVNDLNIKDQALSISGYLSVMWDDDRLDWSANRSQDYTNVPFLFSTEEYVWRPALIVENSVKDISIISDKSIPMRILNDGTVIWNPSGIYEVSCESDTTYYPLDTQECTIKVSSWAYTEGEVSLVFNKEHGAVDLSFYSMNGEWDLISASGSKSETKSRGGSSFSGLSFSIKLQRRPMFHIINTLFPVALMAVLISMVFKLPVDSGEKIGFSLTVLLAYAVYLTLISDNIPSTSVHICYLSIYLVLILTLGAMSVPLTIFVLSLYFKDKDEVVPDWLKNLNCRILLRIAGRKSCLTCCGKRNETEVELFENISETTLKKSEKKKLPIQMLSTTTGHHDDLTWKQLSHTMDKVFFNIYIGIILLITAMLFLSVFVNYYVS